MTQSEVHGGAARVTAGVPQWRRVLLVGAVVALAATFGRWAVAAGVGLAVQPVAFAVVVAAVIAGRPARWGSAAALLLTGSILAGWSSGVAWCVAAFAAAAVSSRLSVPTDGERGGRRISWFLRNVIVAVSGVLIFAATGAMLLDLFGQASFSLTVDRVVLTSLPLALVGVPLVCLTIEHTELLDGRFTNPSPPDSPVTATTRAIVLLIALGWTVSGYIGSFLFRIIALSSQGSVAQKFSPVVGRFVAVWGWQGVYAQLLLGTVSLAIVGLLLRR